MSFMQDQPDKMPVSYSFLSPISFQLLISFSLEFLCWDTAEEQVNLETLFVAEDVSDYLGTGEVQEKKRNMNGVNESELERDYPFVWRHVLPFNFFSKFLQMKYCFVDKL